MKQVVQELRRGKIAVDDVPPPALRAPGVLVATACSLISPGTERAALELGRSSLLGKALRRPDQVRKVLDTFRRDGFRQTWNKVQARLDASRALGYSCAGVVLDSRECDFSPGERVACVGKDAATHAEINFIPRNLCAAIPEGVSFEEASFAALGGIALHAVHLAEARLGEDVAVVGLGPVGLLLAQCLRAAGCRVAGFDLREERLHIARELGADWTGVADASRVEETLLSWGIPAGFDSVFIAAASSTAAPVEWAVAAARDRGKIIVIGDVRTDFPRNACYAKELSIVYARSYGPGRYDPVYEEQGVDYPRAYVRWTLGRNLEHFLDLLARGQVKAAPLVTHRLPIEQAARAYEILSGAEPSLGVLLQYPLAEHIPSPTVHIRTVSQRRPGALCIGFIGAGSHAAGTLLPLLHQQPNLELVSLATTRGVTAKKSAAQFGFARCTTDAMELVRDPGIDAVVIATRHDSHAGLVAAAIESGKHFLVEKPLCINDAELARLAELWQMVPMRRMIAYNRRFAPATAAVRDFIGGGPKLRREPLQIRYAVCPGRLQGGHWLHDPTQGGRIVGEVCHFVDWCEFVVSATVRRLFATLHGSFPEQTLNAVLDFEDGSVASITYNPSAHPSLPKERVEISTAGRTAILEDFVRLTLRDDRGTKEHSFKGKGHAEMVAAFCSPGPAMDELPLLPFGQWASSARVTLQLLESASTGLPVWSDLP